MTWLAWLAVGALCAAAGQRSMAHIQLGAMVQTPLVRRVRRRMMLTGIAMWALAIVAAELGALSFPQALLVALCSALCGGMWFLAGIAERVCNHAGARRARVAAFLAAAGAVVALAVLS